ncbi:MAG: O-antigen ligase family protein, partial [Syntrophomonadaceae bacterium]|nr:O-antigen ligase family protein [Syntrophomonadaceae bacterium]
AETKTLYICTLVLWSLAAPALIISTDPRRLKRLAVIFACLSFVVAIEAFTGYLTSGPNSFIYVYGSNYLGLGRVIGLSLILVIVYFLFWSNILHERIFAILLALFYLWILLVGGGRGPLLAALFAALIPLLFSIGVSEGKLKIRRFSIPIFTLIILCIAILGYLNETGQMTLTLNRLTVLQEAGMGKSAGARMEYYIYSFDLWKHSTLFGHGIGSWPIISGLGDIRNYPHNIMLEILVELGLIGFIIFGILIWAAFSLLRPINRIAYEPIKMLLIMLTVFMLFNAMLSGDISDNRLLFACIGLMPAAQFINRNVERI